MSKRENLSNEERSSPVCYGHSHELREEFKYGDTFEAPEKEGEEAG